MALTDMEVRREIRRLAVAFAKPDAAEDDLVGLWRHVLDDVEVTSLMSAVGQYVRSDARYFPKPGQIRALALEIESQSYGGGGPKVGPKPWNQTLEGPCPVCGAVLQMAPDPGGSPEVYDVRTGRWRKRKESDPPPPMRYRVVHDGREHQRQGVPAVGEVRWGGGA